MALIKDLLLKELERYTLEPASDEEVVGFMGITMSRNKDTGQIVSTITEVNDVDLSHEEVREIREAMHNLADKIKDAYQGKVEA